MMQHVQRNNGCPCCRATLIEDLEEDDEEDEDYEDSDVESIQDDEGEDADTYPIERLVEVFESKGYGLKDAISLLMYRFSKTDEKYTKAYIQKLEMEFDDANYELGKEYEEQVSMAREDGRIA